MKKFEGRIGIIIPDKGQKVDFIKELTNDTFIEFEIDTLVKLIFYLQYYFFLFYFIFINCIICYKLRMHFKVKRKIS